MKSKLLLLTLAGCLLTAKLFAQCTVHFSAQQNAGSTDVTFYADSITGGSFLSQFTWSFGDGTAAAGSQVSHHYTLNGPVTSLYTVCLTMQDSTAHCTVTTCDTIVVSGGNCSTSISYTNVDSLYTFAAASIGTAPYTYSWTLDGQTVPNGVLVLPDTPNAIYSVCVTMTDNTGCTASDCSNIYGTTPGNNCNSYASYTNQDSLYTFSVSHIGAAPVSYVWTFGNNTLCSTSSLSYVFDSATLAGSPVVCVTVADSSGCSSSDCITLGASPVLGGCQAYFVIYPDSFNSPAGYYTGYNYSSGSYGVNVLWDFGDGSTSTNPYPSHNYATPGIYIVCLTVGVAGTSCYDTYCDSSFYAFKTAAGLMTHLSISSAAAGINSPSATAAIQLYPNPVNSELNISTSARIDQARILGTDGQLMMERKSSATRIDVSKLPAGVYILELSAEGQISRNKFIKD